MGYACPVCGDPQADGEHLANHLAFTAMLGDADHEDWLDEHAPDWGESDPAELADRVTDHADEREFPQVFEDTTGDHAHDHSHGHGESEHTHGQGSHADGRDGHAHGGGGGGGVPENVAPGGVADPADLLDDDGERDPSNVLAEARKLTEQRRTNAGEDAAESDDDVDSTDGDGGEDGDE